MSAKTVSCFPMVYLLTALMFNIQHVAFAYALHIKGNAYAKQLKV